jgi:hypothetical protein
MKALTAFILMAIYLGVVLFLLMTISHTAFSADL